MHKKVKLINHDCLPILMLLCIMPYIMLAYSMLFAALSNAVCLYDTFFFFLLLIFANAFCLHALSWFVDTWFVYFKYDLPSCAMLLIFFFFLILCPHHFICERAMCSPEK